MLKTFEKFSDSNSRKRRYELVEELKEFCYLLYGEIIEIRTPIKLLKTAK
jgi:hypothetical protein